MQFNGWSPEDSRNGKKKKIVIKCDGDRLEKSGKNETLVLFFLVHFVTLRCCTVTSPPQ
jgi:hypothetical protein